MPLYEFKCRECGTISTVTTYGVIPPCQMCGSSSVKRKYSFYVEKSFVPHFNPSVGKYVSSQRQFNDELKVLSDEQTLRTGIPHNYVPTEMGDRAGFGISDEDREEYTRARYDHPSEPESLV